jgi:hypothetical protein
MNTRRDHNARSASASSSHSPNSSTPTADPGDRALSLIDPDDRVLTFREWCSINRFSLDTGRRRVAEGAVDVVQLSPRRIGITTRANRKFHEGQTRKRG